MLIDLEMLRRKYKMEVDGVLHVGGHHGEEAMAYSKAGWAPVFWIEAETDSMGVLEAHIAQFPGNIAVQAVVADEPKPVVFNHANNGQSSSILEFGTHTVEHPDVVFTETVGRMATTIDELLSMDLISRCNLINIDIQGAELLALKGALDYLETVDYLYLEVNKQHLYKGGALLPELDTWLDRIRFTRVEIEMTPHGWGDAFWIREGK